MWKLINLIKCLINVFFSVTETINSAAVKPGKTKRLKIKKKRLTFTLHLIVNHLYDQRS